MANAGPNTGTSQFFVNLKNNTGLDFDKLPYTSKHPVFGIVISGKSVVDVLGLVPTDSNNKPLTDIRMDSVRMTYLTPLTTKDIVSNSALFKLAPNPTNLNTDLHISMATKLNATIAISTIEGKVLHNANIKLSKGLNKIALTDLHIEQAGLILFS